MSFVVYEIVGGGLTLYVGVSSNLSGRIAGHRISGPVAKWRKETGKGFEVRVLHEVKQYEVAHVLEIHEIQTRKPLLNKAVTSPGFRSKFVMRPKARKNIPPEFAPPKKDREYRVKDKSLDEGPALVDGAIRISLAADKYGIPKEKISRLVADGAISRAGHGAVYEKSLAIYLRLCEEYGGKVPGNRGLGRSSSAIKNHHFIA